MFAFKKNREIRHRIDAYIDTVLKVVMAFRTGLSHYMEKGIDAHFHSLVEAIHADESHADDIRREIEVKLFAQSLLPESREDIFLLLETIDMLANQSEDVLRQIAMQQLALPSELHAEVAELADIAVRAAKAVVDAVRDVLGKAQNAEDAINLIDRIEGVGDRIEQRIIGTIFKFDAPTAEKILWRDLVEAIGSLCDLAEDVGLRLSIMAVKRRI